MKTDIIKQEILLMITSSGKELCENNVTGSFSAQSRSQELEEACWNGLLDELLRGIIIKSISGKRLCIWEIRQGQSFLDIQLCNYPSTLEKRSSINPYNCLSTMTQN